MNVDLKSVGERIKEERKAKDMTQTQLAEKIMVTPHYIYEIERGTKIMSLETLILLSEALELSVDYMLFGKAKIDSDSEFAQKMATYSGSKQKRLEEVFKMILDNLVD